MRLIPFETRLWRAGSLAAAVCFAVTGAAFAESSDEPALQPARELWTQGQRYFKDGDYVRAADSFDRAYEVERVPSLGLWVARSLARAGRLVEAEVRYHDLAEQTLPPDAPQKEWLARSNADVERRLLAQRIASVGVVIDGVASAATKVWINGELVPTESLSVPRRVDPGLVRVRGEAVGRSVMVEATLAEGETQTVRLSFIPEPPPPEPGRRSVENGARVEPSTPSTPGETQRVLSYVAVGLGGAALLTGGAFGIQALDDQARLRRDCPNDRCPQALASDVNSYDSKRTVANVALLTGAALVTTGIVLFFTAPRSRTLSALGGTGVYWAGSSFGLTGRFR